MQILVTRDTRTANSVTSTVQLNGGRLLYGLEPPNPIPAGEYEVWLRWSAKNGRWVLAVMDVPGHSNIEVHIGNFPKDTLDCLLVGDGRDTDIIHGSHNTYQRLFLAVMGCLPAERVTIKYVDAYTDAANAK